MSVNASGVFGIVHIHDVILSDKYYAVYIDQLEFVAAKKRINWFLGILPLM